jgi:hypothetical protein
VPSASNITTSSRRIHIAILFSNNKQILTPNIKKYF